MTTTPTPSLLTNPDPTALYGTPTAGPGGPGPASGTAANTVTDRGAWAASTAYNAHDLVEYQGTAWVCATTHTSGVTFDETKFTELDGFRGAWQANTRYLAGDTVVQAGALYSANATFTSAGSFNAANWTALSGASTPPLAPVATVTAAGALVPGKHNPVDATSGPLTMTLPTGQPLGTMIGVEKEDGTANAVTISGSIRGSNTSNTLTAQFRSVVYAADASGSWWPFSDVKPLAYLQTLFASLASPAFTGTPAAPTPAPGDNTTKLATTAFVAAALSGASGIAAPWAGPSGTPGQVTSAGAAVTDPVAGNYGTWWGVMNAATPTITFNTPTARCIIRLRLDQDATGGRVPSFVAQSGALVYPTGTWDFTGAQAAANATSWAVLVYDGTNFFLFPDSTGKVFMTNPMSAANDLIVGGASGTPARLATVASKFLGTDASGNIGWLAGGSSGPQIEKHLWKPTAAAVENIDRKFPAAWSATQSGLASGRLSLVGGAEIPAGVAINNVAFVSGTVPLGTYEVDSVIATGATSGTFTLSFTWKGNVYTTGAIAFNASAGGVQAAILAATRTGPVSFQTDTSATAVTCTLGPLPNTAVTITFSGLANGPVSAQSANNTSLVGGTAAFTQTTLGIAATNQWACLVDQNLNVLAKSSDLTNTAWPPTTVQTFPLSSTYTPGADIAVYAGIVVVCTGTLLNFMGIGLSSSVVTGLAPVLTGTSTTGLTNPASLGATAAALTANTSHYYVELS